MTPHKYNGSVEARPVTIPPYFGLWSAVLDDIRDHLARLCGQIRLPQVNLFS